MTKPDARGRLDPVEQRRAGAEPASLGVSRGETPRFVDPKQTAPGQNRGCSGDDPDLVPLPDLPDHRGEPTVLSEGPDERRNPLLRHRHEQPTARLRVEEG